MQFSAVNWHEGLFLQPHHFQAWDRHWTERICTGEQWQSPHSYGVLELAINSDALASGFLQIDLLRCKTAAGAIIESSTGSVMERRDLRPSLESLSKLSESNSYQPLDGRSVGNGVQREVRFVDVFVGVPRLKLGDKNVDSADHRNGSRFRAQWLDLPDELDAACIKPVELRELNARVLLSTDDLAGYDVLRIARVRRGEDDDVQLRMDANYVPPLMDCSSSNLLRSQIMTSIYDLMQQCSEQYSKQLFDTGGALHANSPVDVQRLLVLQAVNPAASVLRVLANSRGIHPLTLYVELARLAGTLDLLHPNRHSKPTSPYDHENLGGIFFELKRRILNAVDGLQRAPYRQTMFVGNENGMQLTIERSQFATSRRWFIGIHKGNIEADLLHQIMSTGQLDWKLGSVGQVEKLFASRAPGLELKRCSNIPASLPKSGEWVFYQVDGLESSVWKDVVASGTLAMRISDSSIANREELIGNRSILIAAGRETYSLQFALFGVA